MTLHFSKTSVQAYCLVLALLGGIGFAHQVRAAGAQENAQPMMHHHMADHMSQADSRELVHFPPEMQVHMLRNMRDHVETLDGILHALAAADYSGAARLASEHLGLDSPSAAGCKPRPANAPPPAKGSMDEMMALYMPEAMRSVGLAMHTAASEFSGAASRAASTGDPRPALEALSQITQSCVACHAGYRLR